MKLSITLFCLPVLLTLLSCLPLLAQAPPAAPPSSPSSPPSIPLTPRDPASAAVLTRIVESEKKLIAERDDHLKKANDLQTKIIGLESAAQDQISEIKRAEGWGTDVSYDGEKERFERPAQQAGASGAHAAGDSANDHAAPTAPKEKHP